MKKVFKVAMLTSPESFLTNKNNAIDFISDTEHETEREAEAEVEYFIEKQTHQVEIVILPVYKKDWYRG